jgi:GAF domain-containing protein
MDAGADGFRLETVSEAFVELVEATVGEFDVLELLQILVDQCVRVLGVAASGLMLAGRSSDLQMMAASDQRAEFLELFQVQHDEGPCVETYRSGQVVVAQASDGGLDHWPLFRTACAEAGFSSVVAVPMRLDGKVIGGLNLFGTAGQPAATMTTARVAEAMAKVAAIVIEKDQVSRDRDTLIGQLETALESRVAIEQAKGVLVANLDITANEAFALLRQRARSNRQLLKDVATEVVKTRGQDYAAKGD